MQLVSLYPFDPTGRASANRIENQSLTITPPTSVTDYSYAVPRGAPFYAESLVVKDGRSTGARTLVENVDYWCVIDFLSASVSLNKRISVGIALLDPGYSGTLYVTYQAVGGNYSLADYSILEELIRERYVVKHVSYEQIINLPEGFAPSWHEHQVADMVGMSQVVATMTGIKTAIGGREGSYGQLSAQISNHIASTAAHTPSQIGLGNVKNYDVATLAEATSGAGNKYVVASVLKQYVQQMQPVLTGFITTVNANLAFATKAQLNSYLTSTQSDSKYAFKSDSYTKSQVDALVNGIDVSSSLDSYYTKVQSDAKYATNVDLGTYIKTTVADGRYATKAELSNVYTKTETDSKYPLKTASYTISQSDGRYALKTDLNQYLNLSALESRFVTLGVMNNYYTKAQVDAAEVTSLAFMPQPDGEYMLQLTETKSNNTAVTNQAKLTLTNHLKKSDAYTKSQVDNLITQNRSATSTKIYTRQHNVTVPYRSYSLKTIWRLRYTPLTGLLHINIFVETPFYFHENETLNLASGIAPYQNSATRNTTLYYFGYESGQTIRSHVNDAWIMRIGNTVSMQSNGNMTIPLSFSATNGQEYVPTMGTTVILGAESEADHYNIMQWFNPLSDGWSSVS